MTREWTITPWTVLWLAVGVLVGSFVLGFVKAALADDGPSFQEKLVTLLDACNSQEDDRLVMLCITDVAREVLE